MRSPSPFAVAISPPLGELATAVGLALALGLSACSPPAGNGDASPDAAPDGLDGGDGEPDGTLFPCTGDGDDVIAAAEAPVSFEVAAAFLVTAEGSSPTVDVVGTVEDGRRLWRLDAELPGDEVVQERAIDPTGTWWASEFPEATHGAPAAGYPGAAGVYRGDETSMQLLGLVSLEGDETLVRYDPPIDVVRYPLAQGDEWTTESQATGRVEHIAFNSRETVHVVVDAAGDVLVPAGRFPVLRLRTDLDRVAGPLSDTRITYLWLAECWGRVAQVLSPSGEADPDFTTAETLWRLTTR